MQLKEYQLLNLIKSQITVKDTWKYDILLCYSHCSMIHLELQRRKSCLWRIQSGRIWIVWRRCCYVVLILGYCIIIKKKKEAAVLAGSSVCSLCFEFTGHRRAGRERRESVWLAGQRCCGHPRWGITAHITAGFHCSHDRLETSIILCFLQMRSPSERRQQSDELYAVIDEILANSIPAVSSVNYITYN